MTAPAKVRPPWEAAPAAIRDSVEAGLGAPVVEAVTQPGGFSPGVAARLLLADGRRAFVKAVGPQPNPDSPAMHRREALIAAALPPGLPVPELLASYEDEGWVALVFADVAGWTPTVPWRPDELDRVLAALAELAVALDPAPIAVPTAAERFTEQFGGWGRLVASGPGESADPWAVRHLEALAALEAGWVAATGGTALLHADLRADNILLTSDRVVIVDWPWACTGAAWFDLVGMGPSVISHGGEAAIDTFERAVTGADPGAVSAGLAAVTGYFVHSALQPAPPGLPTLRAAQRSQGEAGLRWLRRRTGWI